MSNQTNKTRRRGKTPRLTPMLEPMLSADFNPFIGQPDDDVVQVIGNPFGGGRPVTREARLEDCEDDCPACMMLREQILSGNAPTIMVFE